MARPERFELPTLCFEGRLASSCNSRDFNHRLHSSRLSRFERLYPDVRGCMHLIAGSLQKSLHFSAGNTGATK